MSDQHELDLLRAKVVNLERALVTRAVIDQAKGVLCERHGWAPAEAFARLRTMSQRTDTKVAVLAELIVDGAQRTHREPADESWAYSIIDLMVSPAMKLTPVRRGDRIVDFRIAYANPAFRDPAGRGRAEVEGRTLNKVYPGVAEVGLFDEYVKVLATGVPYMPARQLWTENVHDEQMQGEIHLHATPFSDGVLVVWSTDPAVIQHWQLRTTEAET